MAYRTDVCRVARVRREQEAGCDLGAGVLTSGTLVRDTAVLDPAERVKNRASLVLPVHIFFPKHTSLYHSQLGKFPHQ
eukprot:768301-Hanusia_phi.AAC.1